MKKRMTKKDVEIKIKDRTDSELIDDWKGLYQAIYIVDCFGVSDLANFAMVQEELKRRGMEVEDETEDPNEFVFTKNGKVIES